MRPAGFVVAFVIFVGGLALGAWLGSRPWFQNFGLQNVRFWRASQPPEPVDPAGPAPKPLTVTLTGVLSKSGLSASPPGEGVNQMFAAGDPVTLIATLGPTSAPNAARSFETARGGVVALPAGWGFAFELVVESPTTGARARAGSGRFGDRASSGLAFAAPGLQFRTESNSDLERARAGDAIGYIELIPGVSISNAATAAADVDTVAEFREYLRTADDVRGSFRFDVCDLSLGDIPASCGEREYGYRRFHTLSFD